MKIGNFVKALALTATALTSSCKPEKLHYTNVTKDMEQTMGALRATSQVILKDPSCKMFGKGHHKIPKNFLQKPDEFLRKLDEEAGSAIPQDIVDSYVTMMPIVFSDGKTVTTTLIPQTNYIYKDRFVNCGAIIEDGFLANEQGNKLFVTADYYGK